MLKTITNIATVLVITDFGGSGYPLIDVGGCPWVGCHPGIIPVGVVDRGVVRRG